MESPLVTIAEAAEMLNYSLATIKRMIDKGGFKTVSEGNVLRIYRDSVMEYLDDDESPDGEKPSAANPTTSILAVQPPRPDALPEKQVVADLKMPVRANKIASVEISEDVRQKRKELEDYKASVDIDIERNSYDIKKAENLKQRDLPETLSRKVADLQARETAIKRKEEELAVRITGQENKEKTFNTFCIETDDYCKKKRDEADKSFEDKKEEIDELASKTKFELNSVTVECQGKTDEYKSLSEKVAECQKQLDNIANQAKTYTHQVEAHATQHYLQARVTSGKIADYHDEQANKGWDLQKVLNDLVKQLEALLR
jgi:excisionase family DNA binding protein